MFPEAEVRRSYDSAAKAYAEHLAAELEQKPLDRHLLNRFAEETSGRGAVADIGCGPGHIARYLHERGVSVMGIDLSSGMIETARSLHPGLEFQIGDIRRLDLLDASLTGIVAFYSIIHFAPAELGPIFAEMRRVLIPGGVALISFHAGQEIVHRDELCGAPVNLDFQFHHPPDVHRALGAARLPVFEKIEREPYEGREYPSRRCYMLARSV